MGEAGIVNVKGWVGVNIKCARLISTKIAHARVNESHIWVEPDAKERTDLGEVLVLDITILKSDVWHAQKLEQTRLVETGELLACHLHQIKRWLGLKLIANDLSGLYEHPLHQIWRQEEHIGLLTSHSCKNWGLNLHQL